MRVCACVSVLCTQYEALSETPDLVFQAYPDAPSDQQYAAVLDFLPSSGHAQVRHTHTHKHTHRYMHTHTHRDKHTQTEINTHTQAHVGTRMHLLVGAQGLKRAQ